MKENPYDPHEKVTGLGTLNRYELWELRNKWRQVRSRVEDVFHAGDAERRAAAQAASNGASEDEIREAAARARNEHREKRSGCGWCGGRGCANCISAPWRMLQEKLGPKLACCCGLMALGACTLTSLGAVEIYKLVTESIK